MHRFRLALFSAPSFHRLLKYVDDQKAGPTVLALMLVNICVSSTLTRLGAKQLRLKYLQAMKDVEVTARVLRNYANSNDAPPKDKKALLRAAKRLDHGPQHAIDEHLRVLATAYDFRLFGQKGDKRAFAINCLNAILPREIPHRGAMIRDLLVLIGIHAHTSLIRGTLLKGKT
jgi:hypothetical protein